MEDLSGLKSALDVPLLNPGSNQGRAMESDIVTKS